MNIVKWDPFGEFDRAFRAFTPAVDIHETEKEYVIKADLPDVNKDDVKVEFQAGVLSVEGERKQEKEEKGRKFHKIEREYGTFIRRFAVPSEVDTAKLSAEFKDGVLNVHLPKLPDSKPRNVSIKVN